MCLALQYSPLYTVWTIDVRSGDKCSLQFLEKRKPTIGKADLVAIILWEQPPAGWAQAQGQQSTGASLYTCRQNVSSDTPATSFAEAFPGQSLHAATAIRAPEPVGQKQREMRFSNSISKSFYL